MNKVVNIILGIVIAILLYLYVVSMNTNDNNLNSIITLTSDINRYIDSEGNNIAKIRTLEISKANDLLQIETRDAQILNLQSTVKEYKSVNKKLNDALLIQGSTMIYIYDTLYIYDTIFNDRPAFSKDFKIEKDSVLYTTGNVILGKDVFKLTMTNYDKYNIIFGKERKNIFKAYVPYVTVTSMNPNTKVNEIKHFNVKGKQKKYYLTLTVGYGITPELNSTIFGGIGVSYMLMPLW